MTAENNWCFSINLSLSDRHIVVQHWATKLSSKVCKVHFSDALGTFTVLMCCYLIFRRNTIARPLLKGFPLFPNFFVIVIDLWKEHIITYLRNAALPESFWQKSLNARWANEYIFYVIQQSLSSNLWWSGFMRNLSPFKIWMDWMTASLWIVLCNIPPGIGSLWTLKFPQSMNFSQQFLPGRWQAII